VKIISKDSKRAHSLRCSKVKKCNDVILQYLILVTFR